VPFKLLK